MKKAFIFAGLIFIMLFSSCNVIVPEDNIWCLKNSSPDILSLIVDETEIVINSGDFSFVKINNKDDIRGLDSEKYNQDFFCYVKDGKIYNAIKITAKTKYVYEIYSDEMTGFSYYDISKEPFSWKILNFENGKTELIYYTPYKFKFYNQKDLIGGILIKNDTSTKNYILTCDKTEKKSILIPNDKDAYSYYYTKIYIK